jgi:hypothetical protein
MGFLGLAALRRTCNRIFALIPPLGIASVRPTSCASLLPRHNIGFVRHWQQKFQPFENFLLATSQFLPQLIYTLDYNQEDPK